MSITGHHGNRHRGIGLHLAHYRLLIRLSRQLKVVLLDRWPSDYHPLCACLQCHSSFVFVSFGKSNERKNISDTLSDTRHRFDQPAATLFCACDLCQSQSSTQVGHDIGRGSRNGCGSMSRSLANWIEKFSHLTMSIVSAGGSSRVRNWIWCAGQAEAECAWEATSGNGRTVRGTFPGNKNGTDRRHPK